MYLRGRLAWQNPYPVINDLLGTERMRHGEVEGESLGVHSQISWKKSRSNNVKQILSVLFYKQGKSFKQGDTAHT